MAASEGSGAQPGVTVIGCVQADVLMSPVTELPPAGGTALTEEMSIRVGGAGANAALALAEAGMPVRLMGCLGEDQLGRWMREELEPFGLADELVVVSDQPSGLTVAVESPRRDRTFLTYLGVNRDWGPSMIPEDALACESLLLCDYFVAPGMQGEAARGLLAATRAAGGRTFFDTSWDPGGFPAATRAEVYSLLPWVDVFLPNEAEACALADLDADAAARAARVLQEISGGWVVVKLGPRGCLAAGPDGAELAVPAPAVSAADTTGAGDAFNAGLVRALSEGSAWPDALEAATQFASTIVARPSSERYRPGLRS
ncbi:MAG TPA: carbohydrate kinase family protein [Solirubrobacteraceae bacterium]|nr:carbohydrate kinase family protein [Solirubrobacteraceae bacterium]